MSGLLLYKGGSAMKIEKSTKRIKNIFAFTVMICSLCLFCGFLVTEKASAKKTTVKKGSSTLKNGTFTVSGKGKMPESAMPKAAQKKKIKKIVIKNGVTELPEDAFRDCSKATVITIAPTVSRIGAMAFYKTGVEKITIPKKARNLGYGMLQNCKNLKELTIPGNFWAREPKKAVNKKNLIGSLILGNDNSNIVKKVKFSTDFVWQCQETLGDCEEFEVLETDPYYKSIDGCIYSKDGKRLEAVPYGRKEIDIAEGCETIDVQSYSYNIEAYINGKLERYIYGGCGQIEKFVFPSTFKSVQGSISAYHNHSDAMFKKCTDIEVEFKSDKLDREALNGLWDSYFIWRKSLAKELVRMNYAEIKDDMLIMVDDGELYGYVGEKENAELTIPNEVKYIRDNAFNSLPSGTAQKFSIKSVVLNDIVDNLPENVFAGNHGVKVYIRRAISIQKQAFNQCDNYNIIRITLV